MVDDRPPSILEYGNDPASSESSSPPDSSPTCPFCTIISKYPPINPSSDHLNINVGWSPDKMSPPAYVLLSTEHVVAFLDIAPLTRGHVLVSPRRHRTKVGDLTPEEMSEIGRLLPLIARSVIKAVLPDIPHREADYNIVQNNGPGAAQVVPHVHFHIIPRPPFNYQYQPLTSKSSSKSSLSPSSPSNPATSTLSSLKAHVQQPTTSSSDQHEYDRKPKYSTAKIPTALQKSYIQFGRGARHELDEDEAACLVEEMRRYIGEEWRKLTSKGRL